MTTAYSLNVNGDRVEVEADAEMPLLWILRDRLDLKGTKYGCGTGYCGACLVLIDGKPNHACMVPVKRVGDREVITIEGLAEQFDHALIDTWVAERVPQCGYCQPAQIVAAQALFDKSSKPKQETVAEAMDDVLCRCGTYQRIRTAISSVSNGRARKSAEPVALSGQIVMAEPKGTFISEWVCIEPDNSAVLVINHSEMGQGALNAVATLIAEELEVELSQVRVATAPADSKYNNPTFDTQLTGGSTTVSGEWERLRLAGATVREKLIVAATAVWGVEHAECHAESGVVVHDPTGRRLSYSELAERAAKLTEPQNVELKSPSEFRLIGRSSPRADFAPMANGAAKYGMDVVLPNMAVAVVSRAPAIGAELESFDAQSALAIQGVIDVVEIASGVAVVADDFWSASQGCAALETKWTQGRWQALDTQGAYADIEAKLDTVGKLVRRRGSAVQTLWHAEHVIEARYRTPYLAHCTIEPPNCTANVQKNRCDLWVGTQDQSETQ